MIFFGIYWQYCTNGKNICTITWSQKRVNNQPFWDKKKPICNTSVLFHSTYTASPKQRGIKTQIKANIEPLRHLTWIELRYMRLQHWYCSNYILHNWLPMYMYFSHSKATLSWTIQSIDIKWSNSLIMSIYKYVMPQ